LSNEHSNAPKSPRCPSCTQTMQFVASRFDGLLDFYTFECRVCGVSHVEPALLAVNLDVIEEKHSSKKHSPLFSKLDALEGGQILRACRKRLVH
jgi:hypothetical protein